jgi:hypothetical protein
MKISQLYPDKWLAAKHLQGRSVTVAITAATVEQLFNPRTKSNEPKFILQFHGKQLRLVLNKTQAHALATITGSDDSDEWKGHLVTLSPSIAPNKAETILISRPPEAAKPAPEEEAQA